MTTPATCPIWGTPATRHAAPREEQRFDSPRAGGRFALAGGLLAGPLSRCSGTEKARLTTWIVEQHRAGQEWPLITTAVGQSALRRPALTIMERRDAALAFLVERSGVPGNDLKFSGLVDDDYHSNHTGLQVACEAADQREAVAFLRFLRDAGLISEERDSYRVTFAGWKHAEDLKAKQTLSLQAFVAMWFDSTMSDVYTNGIEPAVEQSGYRPMRIDKKDHVNKIDDEIVAEIRRSRFVIADFTSAKEQPRGGVYFEAGFAFGLRIPVIWTVRQDMIGEIHFDTRQFNHITWEDPGDLRTKLKNRIGAVIGDGPLKSLKS